MQKHFHLAQFDLPHSGAHGVLKTAALQAWLYQRIFQNNRPSTISKELTAFNQAGSYGPSSQILIKRWNEALGRWDKSLSDGVPGRFSVNPVERGERYKFLPEALFEQARLHYYEASGYQKIGRKFDASVLYLWSSELLSQFIQLNPSSPDVPQALFLLGASQVRMRTAFNPEIRSDRLLNLCVELYPDSIWATLARELRREEFGYAV
ncbi:MAG: hypothetical protein H7222_15645 [Methylotenera sp.]|nr:hypothetical protein [Oligoflexia bacterium]